MTLIAWYGTWKRRIAGGAYRLQCDGTPQGRRCTRMSNWDALQPGIKAAYERAFKDGWAKTKKQPGQPVRHYCPTCWAQQGATK